MTTKLFVGNTIQHRHVLSEMESAWREINESLPDHAPQVERKPPHLTLRYLGQFHEYPDDQPPAIHELTETLQHVANLFEPIALTLGPVLTFPGVVWISIDGSQKDIDALNELVQQVDEAVQNSLRACHAVPPRSHPFVPHLTLGKFDPSLTDLVQRVADMTRTSRPTEFTIDHISVIRSCRDLTGAVPHSPHGSEAHLRKLDLLHRVLDHNRPHPPCPQEGATAA